MITTENTVKDEQYQELFKGFAGALRDHLELTGQVNEDDVRRIVNERVEAARLPRPLDINLPDGKTVRLEGRLHHQFQDLLDMVSFGLKNLMMVGPAGSGKTTLAKHVAKALDREFAFISLSAGVTETHLFGRMLPKSDGTWGYVESAFIRIYRNGGVFLFDEIDAADSNVMVAVNAALANGVLANPVTGEVVERHAETLIIAAANTFGRGGDAMYVGRNALDAATLDRFCLATLFVNYDTELEADILRSMVGESEAEEVRAWVSDLRGKIASNKIRRVASTRLVEQAAMMLRGGRYLDDVKARYFQNWSADELAKVQ